VFDLNGIVAVPDPKPLAGRQALTARGFSPAPISTFAFTHNAGGNITAALKEN